MGALVVVTIGTALGTLAALVAVHYARQALKRWLKPSDKPTGEKFP